MSSVVDEFFQVQVSFKSVERVIEEINKCREKPFSSQKEIEEMAKEIKNELFEVEHAIVRKKIEWGSVKGRTKSARTLSQKIRDLLEKGVKSTADTAPLAEAIEEFKMEVMKEVERKLFGESDLRSVPGSVADEEAGNLYFGESYSGEAIQRVGTWLLQSTCIGEDIAVYFTDGSLRRMIRSILMRRLSSNHIKNEELGRLRIHRVEGDKPYTVLAKFLLWVLGEEQGAPSHEGDMTELLRRAEGVIFCVPGKGKEKEFTIPLPRLDLFFSRWIAVPERKKALEDMRDSLYNFMTTVEESAERVGERKKVENTFRLISTYGEILYADLLKSGFINHEPLRQIVDLIVELSGEYDVRTSLSFVKVLTSW
ncbi:MAG: hypothetical protein QXF05_05500 [Thermofilaceae archaeon]